MRRVSIATRDELIAALADRYSEGRLERGRILDEFVALTGYHRKHATRVLRLGRTDARHAARPGRRLYGEAVRQALILLWEASDRVCGKRLKPMLPCLTAAARDGPANCGPDKGMLAARVEPENGGRSIEPTRHEATGTLRMSQW